MLVARSLVDCRIAAYPVARLLIEARGAVVSHHPKLPAQQQRHHLSNWHLPHNDAGRMSTGRRCLVTGGEGPNMTRTFLSLVKVLTLRKVALA